MKVRKALQTPRSALRSIAALIAMPLVCASSRSGTNSSAQGGPPCCPPGPPAALGPPAPRRAAGAPPALPHAGWRGNRARLLRQRRRNSRPEMLGGGRSGALAGGNWPGPAATAGALAAGNCPGPAADGEG